MTDRHALAYVEIDIPICENVYGESPCTASIPTTGSAKCFNCLSTCQDVENYAETEVTLRFAVPTDYLPESIDAIPIITGINFSPAIISLGEDLGQRASLTVNFSDIRWSDTGPGFDPYVAERDWDPYTRGTFWGRFRSRQPYLRGRNLRVIRGLVGQALAEMETRHYIIESFNGPTTDGSYSIIAKDVLKLADGDRAQCPMPSNGFIAADIASGAGSLTLSPTGIGDDEYDASGYLALGGKEVVSFTRSGDTVTLTGRGQLGTTAQAHKAQDRVQTVIREVAVGPADLIYKYLVDFAGVPADYIDLPAWQAEASAFNARLYTTTLAEPVAVKTLVSELIEIAGLAVWWDDLAQKIRLQVLRQISTDAERFVEERLLNEAIAIEEQPERRISQVWTYYGKINPLEGQEDPENYRSTAVTVDLDSEAQYGSPAIRKIFSRWIPEGGRTTATRINDILIGRFRNPPRRFSFSTFRYGSESPTLGEGCVINAWPLQDATGAREDVPMQIVRLNPGDTSMRVDADELRFTGETDDPSIRDIIFDSSLYSAISIKAQHDLLYPVCVGGETVNFSIEESATVGQISALSTDFPTVTFSGTTTNASAVVAVADTSAFKVGMAVSGPGFTGFRRVLSIVTDTSVTLDANASASATVDLTLYTVILNLYMRGRAQGPGGNGGQGRYAQIGFPASVGTAGGPALYVRYPLNLFLDDGLGRLWGGGGGGGGAGVLNLDGHKGGGGGGGAGIPGGSGGVSYYQYGAGGSVDAGGIGGSSFASFAWSQFPYDTGVRGGTGGAPGAAGATGDSHGGGAPGEPGNASGGAAGAAIDGTSYVNKTGTGNLLGGEIN